MDKLSVSDRLARHITVPALELCDYASSFFLAIEPEKWTVGTYDNYNGQKCAIGHAEHGSPFANALKDLFSRFGLEVESVNDASSCYREHDWYRGRRHPQRRVLDVLDRIHRALITQEK